MLSWGNIPRRHALVILVFLAIAICYMDRVNISVAIVAMAGDLGWDYQTQGLVLSSFFAGYLLMQALGGRLADRFGGKLVLGVGVLLWSFFTLITPPAATAGMTALLIARVAMGMSEAVTFPAFYSLYSRWIPLSERSRAVGFTNSAIPLGTAIALLSTPIIVEHFGWEWAFYSFGILGPLWWCAWHWSVTSKPNHHPLIQEDELHMIREQGGGSTAPVDTPWIKLLSCPAVWAIMIATFCNNWTGYVLLSWLPTYVSEGLGVEYESVGVLSMMPFAASFIALNLAGSITDRLIASGMSVLSVRRLMQTISFGSLATMLLLVGQIENAAMAIAVMSLGMVLAAAGTGGFAVNHMDIAPRHAGALMGITNTAGTLPGIIGVTVTGTILEATGSWALAFAIAAAVTVFGLAFFLIFVRATVQVE
jgi:MFS family permease